LQTLDVDSRGLKVFLAFREFKFRLPCTLFETEDKAENDGEKPMKRREIIRLGLAILALLMVPDIHANEASEKAALTSAIAWLTLADGGKYSETWDQAATYFKDRLTKDQWIASLKGGRTPLGKVLSRKLKSKMYTKSLPGVPDGEYVVIMYDTQFENKKSAVETITPMLDKDGKWRVAGYLIH
jgi:Protein of unknown function (DUF4019)